MVSTTPTVEDICGKNNLNFVQLLKPFENFDNLKMNPVKVEGGPSGKRIQSMSIRFVSFAEVNVMNDTNSDKYLSDYCKNLAPHPPVQLTHLRNCTFQNQSHYGLSSYHASIANSYGVADEKSGDNKSDANEESHKLMRRRSTIPQALRICSVDDVDRFFERNKRTFVFNPKNQKSCAHPYKYNMHLHIHIYNTNHINNANDNNCNNNNIHHYAYYSL
ncbi:hypothetical protein RFI_14631 [Reticulomyxa filosa]|uniref:Uncharacterized protein n=1 Tax=Reticulomyxa filosa TaxID=46433 RepID=X6N9F9_RETFI|nr:hypothetical protein RFI_14631 [Reticulomyxa filosa]|eukprot:ETO22558.1 hypothetical protein RFI_14631 [Reticulomyxa filosa]